MRRAFWAGGARGASPGAEMAGACVPVPASAPPPGPGSFVLIRRGDEWDEVLVAHAEDNSDVWLSRTTTPNGGAFMRTAVRLAPGRFSVPFGP